MDVTFDTLLGAFNERDNVYLSIDLGKGFCQVKGRVSHSYDFRIFSRRLWVHRSWCLGY